MKPILLAVLAAIVMPTARAGHWTISFNCYGQTQNNYWNPPEDGPGVGAWPAHVDSLDGEVPFGTWAWTDNNVHLVTSGSVTPMLHWNRDTASDAPPPSVDLLLNTDSRASHMSNGGVSKSSTSLPSGSYLEQGPPPADWITVGAKVLHLTVPSGADDVWLPAVSMSAETTEGPFTDDGPIGVSVTCQVALVTMDISGSSTAGTSPGFPKYFSGTNCSITGSASLPSAVGDSEAPTAIVHEEFLINGRVIGRALDVPGPETSLTIHFDSTAFPSDAPIVITYRVTDDHNQSYEFTRSALAKNRALLMGNQSIEQSHITIQRISAVLQPMNHWVNPLETISKHDLTETPLLAPYSVFYASTHGDYGPTFWDSYEDNMGSDGMPDEANHLIGPNDIDLSKWKNDSQPPFNLVFLDGCISAGEILADPRRIPSFNFGEEFLSWPDSGLTDRCFLGWGYYTFDSQDSEDWTLRLFAGLCSGQNLFESVMQADAVAPMYGLLCTRCEPWFWNNGPIEPSWYGDVYMKLHGVYGGTGLDWCRPSQFPQGP